MARKATLLSDLRVNAPRALDPEPIPAAPVPGPGRLRGERRLKKKTFEVTPEADREFEILRAETGKTGIDLVAEALNLLFAKYNRPQLG